MNVLKHVTITIEADVWEALDKEANRSLDAMLADLRTKKLLQYFGNLHTKITEEVISK